MRIRGQDVAAKRRRREREAAECIAEWGDESGATPEVIRLSGNGITDIEALGKDLALPEGSRGMIYALWRQGGGHIWSWEKNGSLIEFCDPQTGKKVGRNYLESAKPGSIAMFRIDNQQFTGKLSDWIIK